MLVEQRTDLVDEICALFIGTVPNTALTWFNEVRAVFGEQS